MHSHEDESGHAPYVVSLDQTILLRQWTIERGFRLPDRSFFHELRSGLKEEMHRYFPDGVEMLDEEELRDGVRDLLRDSSDPVVSLDPVYAPLGVHLLQQTRMVDIELNSIGEGSRNGVSLSDQLDFLVRHLRGKSVQLVDDVVFSGGSLTMVVDRLKEREIEVSGIVVAILKGKGYQELQGRYPSLPIHSVRFYNLLKDEVCERDFFAGVPMSGRLIGKGGLPFSPKTCAPYFLPFGNPVEWASIPSNSTLRWSVFCLEQSIQLWEEIGRVSGRQVQVEDLERRPRFISPRSDFLNQLRNFRDYYREYI